MAEVKIFVNDKEIGEKELTESLALFFLKEIEEKFKEKLADVRCAEHDVAPTILVYVTDSEEFDVQVKGCCQKLIDTTENTIANLEF